MTVTLILFAGIALAFALVPIVIGGLRDMKGGFGAILSLVVAVVIALAGAWPLALLVWLASVIWCCVAPTKKRERLEAKRHAELLEALRRKEAC
jgi:hypothetical protein